MAKARSRPHSRQSGGATDDEGFVQAQKKQDRSDDSVEKFTREFSSLYERLIKRRKNREQSHNA